MVGRIYGWGSWLCYNMPADYIMVIRPKEIDAQKLYFNKLPDVKQFIL